MIRKIIFITSYYSPNLSNPICNRLQSLRVLQTWRRSLVGSHTGLHQDAWPPWDHLLVQPATAANWPWGAGNSGNGSYSRSLFRRQLCTGGRDCYEYLSKNNYRRRNYSFYDNGNSEATKLSKPIDIFNVPVSVLMSARPLGNTSVVVEIEFTLFPTRQIALCFISYI